MNNTVKGKIAIFPVVGIFCLLYGMSFLSGENFKEEEILARTNLIEGVVAKFEKRKILTGKKGNLASYPGYFVRLNNRKEYELEGAYKLFKANGVAVSSEKGSIDVFDGKKVKLFLLEDRKVYQIEVEDKTILSFSAHH